MPDAVSDSQPEEPRLVAGLVAVVLAVLVWACPSILIKALPMEALPIVFFRGWIGVAWAFAALYIGGGRMSMGVLRYALLGGLALGIDLMTFFLAIKMTTVANATLISAMPPVLLIFLAPWLFKEKVGLADAAAALIAIGGAGLVAYGSRSSAAWDIRGDLVAVITLVAWTFYLIFSKRAGRHISPLEFTAGVTLIASILVTPFVLVDGHLSWPEPLHWLALGAMAVLGWSGHVLMNWSLRHIPVWVGGTAALAVPVASTMLAALFLGEAFLPIQMVGMAVVVFSLTVVGVRSPAVLGQAPKAAAETT